MLYGSGIQVSIVIVNKAELEWIRLVTTLTAVLAGTSRYSIYD